MASVDKRHHPLLLLNREEKIRILCKDRNGKSMKQVYVAHPNEALLKTGPGIERQVLYL